MTTQKLTNIAAVCAIVAGLLFIVIQPLHPPDSLESVTRTDWAVIHWASLVMQILFIVGITGIYASQVEQLGWLGLFGYVVLVVGLLLTAIGTVIEAFVQPFIASTSPSFVQAMLDMVEGRPIGADLGPLPLLWSISSACFLVGTIVFGLANFRAGILSRWASAVFGVGLLVMAPVVAAAGAPRLAALPIGLGLAWLGYSLLTRRLRGEVPAEVAPIPQPSGGSAA
jgi:hypothetical protein